MAEVSEVSPFLLDFVRQQIGQAITNDDSQQVRPESLDLGERTRRMDARSPFVLTCDSFARSGRYIVLWCNPHTWSWTLHQRGTVQPTRGGRIVNMWRDRLRDTYYDEAQVTITFQSGNIMPIRTRRARVIGSGEVVSEADRRTFNAQRQERGLPPIGGGAGATVSEPIVTTIAPGLLNFYEYLELKDERRALDDGSMNFVSIIASTPMFPQLVLKGFFNPDGLSWSETADDPNAFEWTDSFTVTQTYPRLKASVLRSTFEQLSGKSVVNRVLVDQTGLRRDENGNIVFGAAGRTSPNAVNPPNLRDRAQLDNPRPGIDPAGRQPNEVSSRDARIRELSAISNPTPDQLRQLNELNAQVAGPGALRVETG